jgi:hypothetical protein
MKPLIEKRLFRSGRAGRRSEFCRLHFGLMFGPFSVTPRRGLLRRPRQVLAAQRRDARGW